MAKDTRLKQFGTLDIGNDSHVKKNGFRTRGPRNNISTIVNHKFNKDNFKGIQTTIDMQIM